MYVVIVSNKTGRCEPMKVTQKQYEERCAEIGQKPTRFKTLEKAQEACDHVNPQEDTADEGWGRSKPMSEYIKREDVLKSRISVLEHIHGIAHTMFVVTVQDINDVPAADVEPVVRGEWREFDADMNAYVCSVCDEPYVLIDGTPEQNHYNYCPNCGAHMERSGSDE